MAQLKCADRIDKPIAKGDPKYLRDLKDSQEAMWEGRDHPEDPVAQAAANDARRKVTAILPQERRHLNNQDTRRKRVADLVKKAIDLAIKGLNEPVRGLPDLAFGPSGRLVGTMTGNSGEVIHEDR